MAKRKKPRIPKYQRDIIRAMRNGEMNSLSPGVHHIYVYHDDWCNIFKGGTCNCNPYTDLEVTPKGRE